MTLAEELKWRGLIQDTTLNKINLFNQKDWKLYIGFDATAPSQTIGNLAAMMTVLVFLRHNHQAVILAGGATSLIGDPGGKEQERSLQDKQVVEQNIAKANQQFRQVFKNFDQQVTYTNNLNWFEDFKLLDFLRDVGKHFSMTPLIQRDFIASRLGEGGSGISYAEFSYTLLQGYDYLKLFEDYQCNLQIGGSDQWGNCLSGVELIRRKHQATVDILTLPLIINQATGKKFGKSEEQTIWLDDSMTHASDFYQFLLNTADEDVINYLKIFSQLTKPEIDDLADKHQRNPALRLPHIKLAEELTSLVHNQKLKTCQLFSQLAFKGQSNFETSDIQAILEAELDNQVINFRQPSSQINQTVSLTALYDELINKIPICQSRSQLKEFYDNQALKIILLNDFSNQPIKGHKYTLNEFYVKKLWLEHSNSLGIIVIGKNTIRVLQFD
ncbi:MAG: tyrosine--tRNA ligase [Candidatus Saccharibacteria bacterium]|nr:tyrosine--tRNA ligase [Candidatus Saccharibacteria bacterium]